MQTDVLLPWGMKDGRLVSVDDVPSGLACECTCPQCKRRLIAAKGDVIVHHFRHEAESAGCEHAFETALHLRSKQLICDNRYLNYPRWYGKFPVNLGRLLGLRSEVNLGGGIRTDVLAEFEQEPVAVEIFVAHQVPEDKVAKFATIEHAAMEIDLSGYRYHDKPEAEWREVILNTAHRHWLFPPAAVRAAIANDDTDPARHAAFGRGATCHCGAPGIYVVSQEMLQRSGGPKWVWFCPEHRLF